MRVNSYKGTCFKCGREVAARSGVLCGSNSTGWKVRHLDCEKGKRIKVKRMGEVVGIGPNVVMSVSEFIRLFETVPKNGVYDFKVKLVEPEPKEYCTWDVDDRELECVLNIGAWTLAGDRKKAERWRKYYERQS